MLTERHLEDLRKSGLNDETIKELGFFSADESELQKLLGFDCIGGGLVIPYPGLEGYYRAKSDNPLVTPDGKTHAKYLSKAKVPNHFYILKQVQDIKSDTSKPLIITEGEKKAAKACQEGFPCLGLGGVSSWSSKGSPIPDFDLINWVDRLVYLIFDSDLSRNKDVEKALNKLRKLLEEKGAKVVIRYLPDIGDNKKIGIDDFLVLKGNDEFRKLLEVNNILCPEIERSFDIEGIIKINSKPPTFLMKIKGKTLKLSSEDMFSFKTVKIKALEELDEVISMSKPNVNWEIYTRGVIQSDRYKIEEADHDASDNSLVVNEIMKLLQQTNKKIDDDGKFTPGKVLEKNGFLLVRGKDIVNCVVRMMKNKKPSEIYDIARDMGAQPYQLERIKGEDAPIRVWKFPLSILGNRSTTDSKIESTESNDTGGIRDDF